MRVRKKPHDRQGPFKPRVVGSNPTGLTTREFVSSHPLGLLVYDSILAFHTRSLPAQGAYEMKLADAAEY